MTASPRMNMILGQLVTNEVLDNDILEAMMAVPREYFVPHALQRAAYADEALHLSANRFLLAPLTFARLLQMAQLRPGEKALDIGCTYGYSTAVLAQLCKEALGCERDRAMAETARRNLDATRIANARVVQVNNLAEGYAADAPYDVIVINGAIAEPPAALMRLLKEQGRLVAVEHLEPSRPGASGLGVAVCYTKLGGECFRKEGLETCAPLLPGFEPRPAFRFG